MCVYVRKEEHNINFELVIVDETVAFIHFYQTNCSGDLDEDAADNRHDSHNQHIKSTLKLTGVNVCRELARIFDRLHHRDSENRNPQATPHNPPKSKSDPTPLIKRRVCLF
jgi:hypothetical protein